MAFLLLPDKSGQHMTQLVGHPTNMKPQHGLHDADASSMPFLQQPSSWQSMKVATHARGQQKMKNLRDECTNLQKIHRNSQEDDTNLTVMWSGPVTSDEEM
jgi:hypothetical protein